MQITMGRSPSPVFLVFGVRLSWCAHKILVTHFSECLLAINEAVVNSHVYGKVGFHRCKNICNDVIGCSC